MNICIVVDTGPEVLAVLLSQIVKHVPVNGAILRGSLEASDQQGRSAVPGIARPSGLALLSFAVRDGLVCVLQRGKIHDQHLSGLNDHRSALSVRPVVIEVELGRIDRSADNIVRVCVSGVVPNKVVELRHDRSVFSRRELPDADANSVGASYMLSIRVKLFDGVVSIHLKENIHLANVEVESRILGCLKNDKYEGRGRF
mmetsp:Transcript_11764/g.27276  ORF Transcript_11764/g.27276 Transcript_11764/m.27276 type:complete len:200 (+) Transcript_11764:1064-1663(+)